MELNKIIILNMLKKIKVLENENKILKNEIQNINYNCQKIKEIKIFRKKYIIWWRRMSQTMLYVNKYFANIPKKCNLILKIKEVIYKYKNLYI